MELLTEIAQHLQRGDDNQVAELTRKAVAQGLSAQQILNQGLIAGMNVVGEQFKNHELFLPDVLLAARAMNAGLEIIKPLLSSGQGTIRGRVVLGTVLGDLHDIGKNLVGIMLKGAGLEVIDLGNNVAPERFVDTAVQQQAQVIGMSTLLTTTMPVMAQVINLLRARGLAGSIRTIIGGAPVTAEYARHIGADAYGYDAANAVERVKELLG